jgi:ADP-ribose pyrophosphatase
MLKLRHREKVHSGPIFSVETLSLEDASGREFRRDIVRHPGAVTIVAEDSQRRLAMVRNFRVAVGDWLLELPAGKLEAGEDPEKAALRELEEETGYTASAIVRLGEFFTSPGFADERMHVYEARGLREVGQRLEPGETIEVEMVPLDQIGAMMASGRLRDGKSIAAIALWRELRERPR